MTQGRQTCKILKEIRKRIAEENGIEYAIAECHYKGECLGTCPRCEAEVRYLEQALERKRVAGKVVSLLGISVGLMGLPQAVCATPERGIECEAICLCADTVWVRGQVTDSVGIPIPGVHILEKGTMNGTCSDCDGNFSLRISGKFPLRVSFVGYQTREVKISGREGPILRVVLKEERIMLEEVESNGVFSRDVKSLVAGMVVMRVDDRDADAKGKFVVEGYVTDEQGTPLAGVVISRKRKGKNFPAFTTMNDGKFQLALKRRCCFWFFKEGYRARKMRLVKRDTLGVRVILERVE